MKLFLRVSVVTGLFLGCAGLLLPSNLITNGSFETPTAPVGSFSNFLTGSTAITGWTVVGPEASIVSGSYKAGCCTFPAGDGNQWLDLTGDVSNRPEGVEQTVATTPGTTYKLSFWVGNIFDPSGFFGKTSTVNVFLGGMSGTLIDTATNSSTTTGTQVWEQFNTSFKATSASTTIAFINGDPRTDNSNGLDNVVLTVGSSGTGVPEPSALSLLGIGIAGLGLLRRRKRY